MQKKINWEIIRRDYIQGYKKEGKLYYPSMRDLATKYNISASGLMGKASKNEWAAKRKIYQSKIRANIEQKSIENFSDEASKFDLECFTGARDIIKITKKNIEDFKKRKETLNRQEIKNLKSLSEIRLNAQKEAKLSLGEATDKGELKIIDAKRKLIDKINSIASREREGEPTK
jgi:tryptophanyl-tRNA synthetase